MKARMYACFGMVVAVTMALTPTTTHAETDIQFARSMQCLACHQLDTQRVGPSFTAIADRYGSVPVAAHYLAGTIRNGSRGKWGAIPMPAQAQVSATDAAQLAAWILSLAEDVPD